jgi:hypothetical protein
MIIALILMVKMEREVSSPDSKTLHPHAAVFFLLALWCIRTFHFSLYNLLIALLTFFTTFHDGKDMYLYVAFRVSVRKVIDLLQTYLKGQTPWLLVR